MLQHFGAGRTIGALLFASVLAACGMEPPVDAPEAAAADRVADAQKAAQELAGRLKARLVETMGAEGPLAAIAVCSEAAPSIAAEVSRELGLEVSRTSLRVRNPANTPDARERAVLELWQTRVESGTPAAALEPFESDTGEFLWMKPIVLEPACLTCHGSGLEQNLAETIAERYPRDSAVGYAVGDLRGAFVVRQTLE